MADSALLQRTTPGHTSFARVLKPAWRAALVPYLFIAPFLLFFVALFLVPAVYSLYLSFWVVCL